MACHTTGWNGKDSQVQRTPREPTENLGQREDLTEESHQLRQ